MDDKNQYREKDKCKVREMVMDGYMQIQNRKVKAFEVAVEQLEKKYQEIENED